jgi:hypothetical protein
LAINPQLSRGSRVAGSAIDQSKVFNL